MKKSKIIIILVFVIFIILFFLFNNSEKALIVALPENTSDGYIWDTPAFDNQYFILTSERSYIEDSNNTSKSQYHEWTLTPVLEGITQVVFTQYDSQTSLESKTDHYRKVVITCEIKSDFSVKELDRIDLIYK